MFCVPFVYQKGWSAVVNGTSVPVYNINGGLLGIPLNEGISNIVLFLQNSRTFLQALF